MKKLNLKDKCLRCGCTGIHACMGDTSSVKSVDSQRLSTYNTIDEAIEHIRISEAKARNNQSKERKNVKRNRGS